LKQLNRQIKPSPVNRPASPKLSRPYDSALAAPRRETENLPETRQVKSLSKEIPVDPFQDINDPEQLGTYGK
jgi:hypothetical protein